MESLAVLSPAATWKRENILDEMNSLAKDNFRHSTEGISWLLAAYSKTLKR